MITGHSLAGKSASLAALALGFFSLFATAPSVALRSDREQPLRVSADTVDVNQKSGVSKYSGNVVLIQGTLRIEAAEVIVYLKDGEVERVAAKGSPMTLRQRIDGQELEVIATARRLSYYTRQQRVALFDQVSFRQGADEFHSDVLHYNMATTQLTAEAPKNPERVHSVIHPRKKATPAEPENGAAAP